MPKPTVSIIIPAYNEADVIGKCLQSCADQTVLPEEVLVVNNNSSDETVAIVKKFAKDHPELPLKLLHEKEQGMVPARDKGLDEAVSDVLGRIDSDTILEPGWVEGVKEIFLDDMVDAASGPMLYHDMPLRRLGFRIDDKIRSFLHKTAKKHKFVFGSNMAIRNKVWHDVKPLIPPDEHDIMHEDLNISLTLCENEYSIAYSPLMPAAMSARRLDDSPREFYDYIMRFERTYKTHELKSAQARIPIFIYLFIYFPVRTVRKFYDQETNKLTFRKLIDDSDFKWLNSRNKDDVDF